MPGEDWICTPMSQRQRETWNGSFPGGFRGNPALLTPWSLDSGPPGPWEKTLLFQATHGCSALLRQPGNPYHHQRGYTLLCDEFPPARGDISHHCVFVISILSYPILTSTVSLKIRIFQFMNLPSAHGRPTVKWSSQAEWWKSTGVTYTCTWGFRRWGSANRKKRGHYKAILAQSKLKIHPEPLKVKVLVA